ncbi:MAG: sialate O-acetylesterase [Kiritimatiellales bacterium]|jgi:hypothetical protein
MKNTLKFILPAIALWLTGYVSAAPVYCGFYHGSQTNAGLYTFTNLQHPFATIKKRIGSWPFPPANWQGLGFDGLNYYTFGRTAAYGGAGLHKYDGVAALPLISGTCTFADWHGIDFCNGVYYGLYHGTAAAQGLYCFTNAANPFGTGSRRLFILQTFPSSIWRDVAFDGTRYLFVRSAAAGNPGIYQYNANNKFTLVSGAETYADWEGLGVYEKKVYVFLFGGQSNALGWGYHQYLYDTTNSLAFPQTDVEMFAGKGLPPLINTLTKLQSGAGNPTVKAGSPQQYPALTGTDAIDHFGPELSMGRTARDLISDPCAKVAVIKYAVAGTSLWQDWKPDGTANSDADGLQYRNFQATVQSGLAALQTKYPDYEIKIIGMGWVQGESDALEGQAANYFTNLTNFVADVRATFGKNIVFALSKLSPNQNSSTDFATVRTAQESAAATVPGVAATDTTGAKYPVATGFAEGSLHYKSPALLQIGEDLGVKLVLISGLH